MAKEERPRKPRKGPEGGGEGEYTSTRLYSADSRKLSGLAALRGESVADTFRKVFGKLLDTALIAAAEGNRPHTNGQ